jgi:hypothetical protein
LKRALPITFHLALTCNMGNKMKKALSPKGGVLFASLICVMNCTWADGQSKSLLSPLDCTNITYPATDYFSRQPPAEESPDHTRVAYAVQVPNIARNENQTLLYVKRIDGADDSATQPILTNPRIAGIHWLPDSRTIAALVQIDGKTVLAQIDAQTSALTVISDRKDDVEDFSIDRNGDVLAAAFKVNNSHSPEAVENASLERGYRISTTASGYADPPQMRTIFLFVRGHDRRWKELGPVTFTSPLTGKEISAFRSGGGMDISISPDGEQLLIDN